MNLASVQSHIGSAVAALEAELVVLDTWTQAGFISEADARRLYLTLGVRFEALGRELQGKADCIASRRCDVCSCSFETQGCDTTWDPVRQEFRAGFGSKYDSWPLRMTKADELNATWSHLDLKLMFAIWVSVNSD